MKLLCIQIIRETHLSCRVVQIFTMIKVLKVYDNQMSLGNYKFETETQKFMTLSFGDKF